MMTIQKQKQRLDPDALVSLYQIDLNSIGVNLILYITPHGRPGTTVTFNGDVYTPVDMSASGFGYDGSGSFPTPKIQVANIVGTLTPIIQTYDDLIGAKLTRIRTLETFLDDGATPDPTQIMPIDTFTIEQKTGHNKIYIEWRLSSVIDETDRMLPARLCLRDYCPFTYRQWNGLGFNDINTAGSRVRCIYTGSNYFDENDNATTAANDKCGKTLNSCMKRFGERSQLGFGGFPGVGRDKSF